MSIAGTYYKVQLDYPLIPLCLGDEVHRAAGGDKRCPYLPKPDAIEDNRLHDFRDQILVRSLLVSIIFLTHNDNQRHLRRISKI
jgi:hypothetical protein